MNDIKTSQLVEAVANILNLKETNDLAYRVAVQVMMLPDPTFQQLFVMLSFQMNVNSTYIMKLFVNNVVMMQLWNCPVSHNIIIPLKFQDPHFKRSSPRVKALTSQEAEDRFAAALQRVIESSQNKSLSCKNYSELCQEANQHFILIHKRDFWRKLSLLIPEKTDKQLRDYYQKSFLRNMYTECISDNDKVQLCNMVEQMPNSKPSQIANRFAELVGESKYFKRNLVMYIVNRKGK
ncbi:Hypothetical_protein [Hexamita inflata]|uniref:Hypothetical_protein n=1 Tax=Hexamita inflata TaxID=28002 RepID=A0AA86U8R5_9EUKA|nr:Hypothetical protein HINF_LOCUS30916 [Hexamita inflata]